MSHKSGPVELCEYFVKKLLFLNIKSATDPELCEKMLEYIKCATGPDLWNYEKKC